LLDFSFTEEQEALRQVVREFAQRELLPRYGDWDRKGEFPLEQWRKMGELGLTGLSISADYGGLGAGYVSAGIAAEEVGRGDFNCAYAVLLNGLIGEVLQSHGSETLLQEFLVPLAKGEKLMGLALTEPDAGSDAASLKTFAVRDGDDYILNGEKSGVSLTSVADAMVVFAKTDRTQRARGITAFVVPMDLPGVTRTVLEDMGNRPIGRGSIFLDNVRIPAAYRLGEEGQGFYKVMNGFEFSRALIALQCLGAAQQSLDETIRHVKERQAFGKPLSANQGVSFPLAEHHAYIDLVRWHAYRTLWLREQNLPHNAEAAICKWLGPKVSREAIHTCLLLNGHYGYTKELPIEQRLRDVIGLEIGDGTAQIQKLVISRSLMGRDAG
jgi:cyclohexanecarboxyl-CoA dehydrogenase